MATRIAVIVDYAALLTERVDHAPALGDILCKRERRLSTLLNAHSLASRLIKRTISFGLNLDGAGYDVLRSPLSFGERSWSAFSKVLGIETASATPEEMMVIMRSEVTLWTPIIKAANIKGD